MRNKMQMFLFSLLLLESTLGFAQTPAPKYCPDAEAIKAVPLKHATPGVFGGWWAAYSDKNKYATNEEWTFMVMSVPGATNESNAITIANNLLPLLQAHGGGPDERDGSWGCLYYTYDPNDRDNDDKTFLAVAMTPPLEGMPEIAAKFMR